MRLTFRGSSGWCLLLVRRSRAERPAIDADGRSEPGAAPARTPSAGAAAGTAGPEADAAAPGPEAAERIPAGSAAHAAAGARTPRWLTPLGVAAFAASVVGLAALDAPFSGPRWSMLDLQIYRWAGLLVRHSGNLYGLRFPHYLLSFTYSPMAALIFAAMSEISLPVLKWLAMIASIGALAATAWVAWGALGYRRRARLGLTLATASVALWFEPVLQTLGFGQVNLVLMAVVLADICLPDSRRLKGVGIGLAAGFKLTPLIFIPYLLLTGRLRAAGVALATFALTIAASLVLLPAQSRQFWFGGLFLDTHRVGNLAYAGNQSLSGALTRLIGSEPEALPYWVVCTALVGTGGLLLAAWAARRGEALIGVVACALTGLLVSPVSWSHHWVWVVPGLVVAVHLAAKAAARPGWRRWAGWLGVAALAGPFFALPQSLVPTAMVQGPELDGVPLLTGSLYVLVGLVALAVAGVRVAAASRVRAPALAA